MDRSTSNQELIKNTVTKYPGLRFHEIKKETKLANGTIQHHISQLKKTNSLQARYVDTVPRYYTNNVTHDSQVILLRLRQTTTSKIIKSLLNFECQTFAQIVNYTKKSPGTVSIYKNTLLADNIIVGNTDSCECSREHGNKVKYRLVDPKKVRLLVEEYGKTSLRKSADNLSDVFLSIQ